MSAAVAVLAGSSGRTGFARDPVHAMRIGVLRICVTVSTTNLGWRSVVRKALYILVTVNA